MFHLCTLPVSPCNQEAVLFTNYFLYHRNRFENQLTAEREATLRYKGENGIMKKKFTVLTKDIEDQKVNLPLPKRGRLFEQGAPPFSGRWKFAGKCFCEVILYSTPLLLLLALSLFPE